MRATLTRDELRGRYLGHHALRRFCAELNVSVDVVRDQYDIGCPVGHAVVRVRREDYDRAWEVAERILMEMDALHDEAGGEA